MVGPFCAAEFLPLLRTPYLFISCQTDTLSEEAEGNKETKKNGTTKDHIISNIILLSVGLKCRSGEGGA